MVSLVVEYVGALLQQTRPTKMKTKTKKMASESANPLYGKQRKDDEGEKNIRHLKKKRLSAVK